MPMIRRIGTSWGSPNDSVQSSTPFVSIMRVELATHRLVLDVRDARRPDCPNLLELDLTAPEVVEEASAAPEEQRDDVQLELVEKPRREVLVDDLGAAPEPHVLAARGLLRLLERPLDPVGDEVESGAPLHLDRLARMMGDDEHVVVVRRGVSPPPPPPAPAPPPPPPPPPHT